LRHIVTAIGSATELETQLEAAIRLHFISRERAQPLADMIDRLQKLLYGLRRERLGRLGASVATATAVVFLLHRFS
jgi:four helix bundle protein